jgi:hypothetical protein
LSFFMAVMGFGVLALPHPSTVSPNWQIPANPLKSLDFLLSHSNDTLSIIILDSNHKPCYPNPCFRRILSNHPLLRPVSPPSGTLFLVVVGVGLQPRGFFPGLFFPLNSLESAFPENTPLTPVESALSKRRT